MKLAEWPLGPLERFFAESLLRLDPDAGEAVTAAAALCCQALANGDVCLPLARLAGQRVFDEGAAGLDLPALPDWLAALRASPLVASPGGYAPLTLDGERLYLSRYHAYETRLAASLLAMAGARPPVDEARLAESLARLFARNTQQPDWQRLAAAQAVRRNLAVISGGPGTGKTTTVVRLLAALLEQPGGERLAIGLAAPTGKAAARMAEAIRNAKAELPVDDAIKALLPEEARTLHRLLGSRGAARRCATTPTTPAAGRAGGGRGLDGGPGADGQAARRPAAGRPPGAAGRQGPALGGGSRRGVRRALRGRGLDAAASADLERITGQRVPVEQPRSRLGDAVVLLTHSHRFAGDSGIGELARRINAGDARGTLELLREARPDLGWNPGPLQGPLLERLDAGYAPFIVAARTGDAQAAFAAFADFRALTAQREGPWGVNGINGRWRRGSSGAWASPAASAGIRGAR